MATTTGSHGVASFTAPINGTSPIDANSVRNNDNALRSAYVSHDADTGIHVQSSDLASRPVASIAGRKWMTVDNGVSRLWFDTGSQWVEVSAAGLSTAQTIALTGDVTGTVSTTLASGASIATTLADNTVTSAKIVNGAIVNDDINASAGIVDTKLATIATTGKVSNSATTATSSNTNNAIVARDGSGNFSAGTITANLTGNVTGNVTGSSGSTTGNAATATALSSNRTFALTGDVTGSVSSNLSSGASISTAIAAGVIVNADINANAEIAVSKLADGAARQLLQTDTAGTGVEWTSNVDVPGTLDVTGATTLDAGLTVDGTTFVVDAANNRVGIGTASPATLLHVNGGHFVNSGTSLPALSTSIVAGEIRAGNDNVAVTDSGYLRLSAGGGTTIGVQAAIDIWRDNNSTSAIACYTSGTERMRLDSNGNVGIGVTPNGTAKVDIGGSVAAAGVFTAINLRNASDGGARLLGSNGASAGLAAIDFGVTGAGAGTDDGILAFYTSQNAGALTERARITAGGYFKASNDGTYNNATSSDHEIRQTLTNANLLVASHTGASPFGPRIFFSGASPDNNSNYFLRCDDSTTDRLFIYSDGDVLNHDGVYGTISDAKLKQDITDAGSQWDDLKAIRFRKYRMKSDVEANGEAAPYLLGVVAQELREVSPGLVESHPDTEQVEVVGEDGETRTETRPTGTETLSVKSSILLMKAAKALQEAMARIEALEARLAALEGAA